MAAAIILFDRTVPLNQATMAAMTKIRDGLEQLQHQRDAIIAMIDGSVLDAASYDRMATDLGYQAGDYENANAAAKASRDEIASLCGKLETNDSISELKNAIYNCCAKHGV